MGTKTSTHEERLIELARAQGVIRARDLEPLGIPRVYLGKLVDGGHLLQLDRGLYASSEYKPPAEGAVVEVVRRRPDAIACLLTALTMHQLTTQNPFQVWIMIDRTARKPVIDYPSIRVVRASGKALTEGVERRAIQGVEVKVTSPAKTIADCFRHRNKIGLDVAIEALRDAWTQRKVKMDDLHHFGAIDRVDNIMRPYLESLT